MPATPVIPRVELDKKGRILIPKIAREMVGLEAGDFMEIEIYGKNKILLTILGK